MTTPEPFDSADLRLMWRVLSLWVGDNTTPPASSLIRARLTEFPAVSSTDLELAAPHLSLPLTLHSTLGWMTGVSLPRLVPPVVPLATLSLGALKDGVVQDAAIRVAFLTERPEEGTVHAEGWRFESAEAPTEPTSTDPDPKPPAHPYCHAQAIHGWTRDSPCLLHPPHPEGEDCDGVDQGLEELVNRERVRAKWATLTSHPAFPLTAKTLTGLAATVVATMYGSQPTLRLLGDDTDLSRVAGPIRADLDALAPWA